MDELPAVADRALFRAKEAGRNLILTAGVERHSRVRQDWRPASVSGTAHKIWVSRFFQLACAERTLHFRVL
jgi:hypothetical protein